MASLKELEEKERMLTKQVETSCNYCGECDTCVELIYLGQEISYEKRAESSSRYYDKDTDCLVCGDRMGCMRCNPKMFGIRSF